MRGPLAWGVGLVGSAVLHVGLALIWFPSYAPEDAPSQPTPRSQMNLETVAAPRQDAVAREVYGEAAREGQAAMTSLGAGAVPVSDAQPLGVQAQSPVVVNPNGETLAQTNTKAATATGLTPTATPLTNSGIEASVASSVAPVSTSVTASLTAPSVAPQETLPTSVPISAVPTSGAAISSNVPEPETLAASEAAPTSVVTVQPVSTTSAVPVAATSMSLASQSAPLQGVQLAAAVAQSDQAVGTVIDSVSAAALSVASSGDTALAAQPNVPTTVSAPLPATKGKAALAWQFGDRVVTDPQALATIQAFMAPATLDNADQVRDDLSSVLSGVDCARLSATFIPEDGVLEMRGHIPDPALQGPILAALRAQVGEGIPVRANLLHLPAPQCGALTGIAEVGLPQSTDQFTNTRIIGDTAHARDFLYSEGQRLEFDMGAPDYDAVVYVDYFDAGGQVIHIQPNLTGFSEIHPAKSTINIAPKIPGTDDPIVIGPPFGQEIAVAFAASRPLYEGLRPLQEPAEPYLEELQSLIAQAREDDPDFKGEWVYFFITTQAATQ